jgi:hypothetical protein
LKQKERNINFIPADLADLIIENWHKAVKK